MIDIDLDIFDVLPGASSAVVTPVGGSAVTTMVQWRREDAEPSERMPYASQGGTVNRRQIAWVRRDEVPSLPNGSTIVGGPKHQPSKTWKVQSVDASHPHYHLAVVG